MRLLQTRIHRFLSAHSFYALAASSVLACTLLAGRIWYSQRATFVFMTWNLVLAWVPYCCSLWAAVAQRRQPQAWWRLLAPGALWLLFFPNAPYIVTDLVHLRERPFVPLWYDLGLLAAFMLSGCFLAVVSLHIMQGLVRRVASALVGWLFVVASVALSGLGVYLGRVQRWNSWDLVLAPRDVLADALRPLLFPLQHIHPLALSAVSSAILAICYVMYLSAYSVGKLGAQPAEPPGEV